MRVSKILVAVTLLVGTFGLQNVVMASDVDETTVTSTGSEEKPVAEISQPVSAFFPDDNLAIEIAEELDLEGIVPNCTVNTVVTDAQLGMIDSLDAQYAGIVDLYGMQYLTGATTIDLSNNQIEYLTPLAGLVNLETLILNSNLIDDVTALSGLTNLTILALSQNFISDVEPISNLTNLTSLYLNNNAITDISSLEVVLSDILYCNFDDQDVYLPSVVVGVPTYVVLENTDGTAPGIVYTTGQGTYNEDTELLTWSTWTSPSDLFNELYWTAAIPGAPGSFSGEIHQMVTPF